MTVTDRSPATARSVVNLRWDAGARIILVAAALATLACGLQGCFVVAAGAVVGGSYAATDRRSIGAQADDSVIRVKVEDQISETLGEAAHVNVATFNHKVLLTGEVASEEDKARAEQIAHSAENVTAVVNELAIAGASSLASRSNDALLTTRVKSQLVNEKDLFANAFKVVSERGTVYLMGRVTQREGDYAANVARSTSGVFAVVKVYDYISEDELHNMLTQGVPASAS